MPPIHDIFVWHVMRSAVFPLRTGSFAAPRPHQPLPPPRFGGPRPPLARARTGVTDALCVTGPVHVRVGLIRTRRLCPALPAWRGHGARGAMPVLALVRADALEGRHMTSV